MIQKSHFILERKKRGLKIQWDLPKTLVVIVASRRSDGAISVPSNLASLPSEAHGY